MGQKIIPISLRLNKNKNWHSQWIVDKTEYSNFFLFDFEIRKYFMNILNYKYFKLLKLNIIKTSKNVHIYIYLLQIPPFNRKIRFNKILNYLNLYYFQHNIKLFIQRVKVYDLKRLKSNIRKIYFRIRKNNRMNKEIKKMMYIFSYALYTKNIIIISAYIKQALTRKKTHKKLITNINKILELFFKTFKNVLGYRLQIKGRINGSKRKRKLVHQKGKIPLNTLKYNIQYNFNEFKTPSGMCSIKLWFFFKKQENNICYSPKKQNIKNNLKTNFWVKRQKVIK